MGEKRHLGSSCEGVARFGAIRSLGPGIHLLRGCPGWGGLAEASWTGAETGRPGLEPVFQGNKLPTSRNREKGCEKGDTRCPGLLGPKRCYYGAAPPTLEPTGSVRRSCLGGAGGDGLLSGLPGRTGQAGGQRAWGHWRCLANDSGEKPE